MKLIFYLLAFNLFLSSSAAAQNIISYSADITFQRKIEQLIDSARYRASLEFLEQKIDSSVKFNAFFDFDYASSEFFYYLKDARFSNKETEEKIHYYFHLIPDLKPEFAFVLNKYLRKYLSYSYITKHSESLTWRTGNDSLKITNDNLKKLYRFSDSISRKGLIELMHYQYPFSLSPHTTYLDHFLLFNYNQKYDSELAKLTAWHERQKHYSDLFPLLVLPLKKEKISEQAHQLDSLYKVYKTHPEAYVFLVHHYNLINLAQKQNILACKLIADFKIHFEDYKNRHRSEKEFTQLQAMYDDIRLARFSVSADFENLNTHAKIFKIESSNTPKIYFHIYKTNRNNIDNQIIYKNELSLVSKRELLLNTDETDCILKKYFIQEQLQENGNYLFLFSNDTAFFDAFPDNRFNQLDFKFSMYFHSYNEFIVNDFHSEYREADLLNILIRDNQYQLQKDVQVFSVGGKEEKLLGKTDQNGIFSIKAPHKITHLKLVKGSKEQHINFNKYDIIQPYYYHSNEKKERSERYTREDRREMTEFIIHTDREKYKPGQTVFFKAVPYLFDDNDELIKPYGKEFLVEISDPKDNILLSRNFKRNQFGSVIGEFEIPKDAVLGEWEIEINEFSSLFFDVEEYKETEKYELSITPVSSAYTFNDTITLSGKVLSNTGLPIEGAQILLSYSYKKNESVLTATTNSEGIFSFKLFLDSLTFSYYNYLNVKCVMPTGETLEESKTLQISSSKYQIFHSINDKTRYLRINTRNQDYHNLENITMHFKLEKKILKSDYIRYAGLDKDFDEETYIRFFPVDNYYYDSVISCSFGEFNSSDSLFVGNLLAEYSRCRYTYTFFYRNEHGDSVFVKDISVKPMEERFGADFTIRMDLKEKSIRLYPLKTKEVLVLYIKDGIAQETFLYDSVQIGQIDYITVFKKYDYIYFISFKNEDLHTYFLSKETNTQYDLTIVPVNVTEQLHPGSGYNLSFEIRNSKGKKIRNAELLALLTKAEFSRENNETYEDFLDYFDDRSEYYHHKPYSSTPGFIIRSLRTSNINTHYKTDYTNAFPVLKNYYTDAEFKVLITTKAPAPLIDKGGSMMATSSREEIANLSVRSPMELMKTQAGIIVIEDEGTGEINIRGSRPEDTYYYIDGVKIRASSDVPKGANNIVENILIKVPGIDDDSEEKQLMIIPPRRRTNFEETVFFQPEIRAGKKGLYYLHFTQNDDINRFALYTFAHTKKMLAGEFGKYLSSWLPVALEINKPRFIREKDTVIFKTMVYNQTDKPLKGIVQIFLQHPEDSTTLNELFGVETTQKIELKAYTMQTLDWKLNIPESNLSAIKFIVQLLSDKGSDIVEGTIPIASNRVQNALSQDFFKFGKTEITVDFPELDQLTPASEIVGAHLYIDDDNTWSAMLKFAACLKNDPEVSDYITAQIYSASMIAHLYGKYPYLSEKIKRWYENRQKTTADKSQAYITKTNFHDVKGKTDEELAREKLYLLLDTAYLQEYISSKMALLRQMQNPDGGFGWYKRSNSSNYISNYILSTFLRLRSSGIKDSADFIPSLMNYLDNYYTHHFSYKYFFGPCSEDRILWLSERHSLGLKATPETDSLERQIFTTWQKEPVYLKSLIGMLAFQKGNKTTAEKIRLAILDVVESKTKAGKIFEELSPNDQGKTLAAVVRFLALLNADDPEIENFTTGLKAQQAYTHLTNYKTTLDFWSAILIGTKEQVKAQNILFRLANGEEIFLKESDVKFISVSPDKINQLRQIQVSSNSGQVLTGGIIVNYKDNAEAVFKSKADELRLERLIYLKENNTYRILKPGETIPLGATIRMELILTSASEMEYMHLDIPRATGLELLSQYSGYRWNNGFSFYAQLKNETIDIFLERIPKGTSSITFDARMTSEGILVFAPVTIQSMEHPALKASDIFFDIKVK